MSHHNHAFLKVPKALQVNPSGNGVENQVSLLVKGQGTVIFKAVWQKEFSIVFKNPLKPASEGFSLRVATNKATFSEQKSSIWTEVASVNLPAAGIDMDENCSYWFSLDCHNRKLRYGKGEMRLGTSLLEYTIPAPDKDKPDQYTWLHQVEVLKYQPEVVKPEQVWRDPVTTEPPLYVVPTDALTMEDIALNHATVAANLSGVGQVLYNNVAGKNYQLNSPDFPNFSDAIEASIRNKNGWCYKTLEEKANEFGDYNIKATYLRITLGMNQGESPGIPYVMEIWPPEHYSPVHNHAGANAIIKVLHGEITVRLFPMLSPLHSKPFAESTFKKGDITWISPQLNQTHQLINENKAGTSCITIQCYLYDENNFTHYEYFDYISSDKNEIEQFAPNSDMDFMAFKKQMQHEWETMYKHQPADTLTAPAAIGLN